VEGVEELLLGALLLGQELDIVNEQNIHVAKLVAEAGHLVVAQRIDHLVGELLARQVADGHLRLAAFDLMPDGLHEMSLAHADSAIEEERVVGLGGPLGHGQRGGVSKLVAGADHESIEGVARVKLSGSVPIKARLVSQTGGSMRLRSGSGCRQPAVMANRGGRGIVVGSYKLDVLKFQVEVVERFLNQVSVFFFDVAELGRGNANINHLAGGMAVASGLEPGIV